MSTHHRLVEVMESALAISSNPAFENDDGKSSTMRPKPILSKTPPIHRPQQRRVQFSDVVTGTVVPSRGDMSKEEKRCIWYCKEDDRHFAECFQQDATYLRECLSRSMSPESDHTTARGMEHLVSGKACRKLIKARVAVILAILDEQDYQRASSIQDPKALAVLSSALSLEARKAGIAKASADQEFALQEQQQLLGKIPTTRSRPVEPSSKLSRWSALRR